MDMGQLLSLVKWEPLDEPDQLHPSDLYATHGGILRMGPFELRVYQLNDGSRVIDSDDMERIFFVKPAMQEES